MSLWFDGEKLSKDKGQASSSKEDKIDQYDPLFLHSNDTSGVPLINFKLEGTENYKVWKAALTIAIHTKNKLGFINGSMEHNQLIKLMQFLMGLDEVYAPIRSIILTSDPLPDVRGAFATLSRDESHRGSQSSSTSKTGSKDHSTSNSFTDDQFKKLMALISDKLGSSSMPANIVEVSGLNMTVGHPNGTKAMDMKDCCSERTQVGTSVVSLSQVNPVYVDRRDKVVLKLVRAQDHMSYGGTVSKYLGTLDGMKGDILDDSEPAERSTFNEIVLKYQSEIPDSQSEVNLRRPDISYAVHVLSQFMHAPLQSHLKLAFRVLRYLKTAPEYRAMKSVTCEVMWILKILAELKVNTSLPVPLHCDNSSAIQVAANPVFHERTKHFEIELFFLREKVANGIVKTVKIKSADNSADIFTKGLSVVDHNKFCEYLGLTDLYRIGLRGNIENIKPNPVLRTNDESKQKTKGFSQLVKRTNGARDDSKTRPMEKHDGRSSGEHKSTEQKSAAAILDFICTIHDSSSLKTMRCKDWLGKQKPQTEKAVAATWILSGPSLNNPSACELSLTMFLQKF
ncbi:ribonuclease H-like domain-containing protein [Tanacetum coccineum]